MISDAPKAGQTVSTANLAGFATNVLHMAGMEEQNAQKMAETLLHAQLVGKNSHGLAHLASYIAGMREGALNPRPVFQIVSSMPAVAILDADRAPGALAGCVASDEAVQRAKQVGVGVTAVRNSSHFGTASAFVKRMLEQGMVAMVLSNASPTVAPRGAREPMLGTNPIAAGFPRENGPPVIIDFASSAGSRGRIRKAATEGTSIPPHWALDETGQPTTDPAAALRGTMQALGGEKGTAIAMMVELFCVAFSGGSTGRDALPPQTEGAAPRGISHLFVAFDPRAFATGTTVSRRVAEIADDIETATPTQPGKPPRMPGARMQQTEIDTVSNGIKISGSLAETLESAWREARNIHKSAKEKKRS